MTDLAIWIDDERILRLVLRWLRTFGWRGRGVAQGAPISPLIANLYLHPFDRLMAVVGWRVVRYADDFVVLTASEAETKRALQDAERLLRGRGLALNRAKTRIVPPGESLCLLGQTLIAGFSLWRRRWDECAMSGGSPLVKSLRASFRHGHMSVGTRSARGREFLQNAEK